MAIPRLVINLLFRSIHKVSGGKGQEKEKTYETTKDIESLAFIKRQVLLYEPLSRYPPESAQLYPCESPEPSP